MAQGGLPSGLVFFLNLKGQWNAFVQQPFGSRDDDFFMEEALKNRFRQKIAYRQESHALMMGHPAIDQFRRPGVGCSSLFKIRRFAKSVGSEPSRGFHLSQIFNRRGGIDAERQNGGIRRYDRAIFYFYLQRQRWNSVGVIMIMTGVIFFAAGALRNPPRNIERLNEFSLVYNGS